MESFFSSLKTERTSRRSYGSRDAARADVFDYIERSTTNSVALGYDSPVQFARARSL
jgi:putative transposase